MPHRLTYLPICNDGVPVSVFDYWRPIVDGQYSLSSAEVSVEKTEASHTTRSQSISLSTAGVDTGGGGGFPRGPHTLLKQACDLGPKTDENFYIWRGVGAFVDVIDIIICNEVLDIYG